VPIFLTCGSCGRKLQAPDKLLGKRVKCPKCGQSLEVTPAVAPDPAPPPPDDDNPFGAMYAPGTAKAAMLEQPDASFPGTRGGWGRVCTGLNLLRFGVVFRALGTLVAIAAISFAYIERQPFFEEADKEGKIAILVNRVLNGTAPVLNMLAAPITVLALTLCMFAPMARGAKLLAVMAWMLATLMLFLYCPGDVASLVFRAGGVDPLPYLDTIRILGLAGLAGVVVELLQFSVCIFFLWACGRTFSQPKAGGSALMLLVLGSLWIMMTCGVGVFAALSIEGLTTSDQPMADYHLMGTVLSILLIATVFFAFCWLLYYIVVISRARGVIVRNLFRLPVE
jgi:hypothetical protein